MQQVVRRLRDFRPMPAVCPCNARCFAAFARLGQKIQEDDLTVVVTLSLVEPIASFPTSFRNVSVCHPECSHMKATQGRIKLFQGVWQQQDPSSLVWIIDASILVKQEPQS